MSLKKEVVKYNKDTEQIKQIEQEMIDELQEEQDEEFEIYSRLNDEDDIIDIDMEFYS